MKLQSSAGIFWILCATLFPASGYALECSIFPETQDSSTSAYLAASKIWMDYSTTDANTAGYEIREIRTPEQSKEILGKAFITPSGRFYNCETKSNPYAENVVNSTCSGDKTYDRTEFGNYTMRMGTVSATFFEDGALGQKNYKWRIEEIDVIIRLDPSDSTKILHIQYVRTSAGYYSCG